MDPRSIVEDLTGVAKVWTKRRKAEERAAKQLANRLDSMVHKDRSQRITIKDAVFLVMEEAIAKTSGGGQIIFPKRNLFYSVRRLIQEHTTQALSKSNFEGIVKHWEKEHGDIDDMYCDPRGFFIEPHTGNVVPLGTREVAAYQIPAWRFNKIIFVEKKGFHGLFKQAQIAERYDIGIMCAEGYSSEAGKLLLARAEQSQPMTILCFHDADPFGYNIARRLREATRAGCQINVIDAGLTIGEAVDMGLEPEVFHRDRALPQGLELNAQEREHFHGRHVSYNANRRPVYECRRVELNDLASDPDRFIEWVESKLEEHGCTNKLVPPRKIVLEVAKSVLRQRVESSVRANLSIILRVDQMAKDVSDSLCKKINVKDMPNALADWAEEPKPEAWGDALGQIIDNQIRRNAKAQRELTRKRMAQDQPVADETQ
jgi:hypothetical protein